MERSLPTQRQVPGILCAVCITIAHVLVCEANHEPCFAHDTGDTWPMQHQAWALPQHLSHMLVVSDPLCLNELGTGASVVHIPPSLALITVNSAQELPQRCCEVHDKPLKPHHKIAPAFWHLVEHASSDAAQEACNPLRNASHECSLLHPSHPDSLVAFEAHLHTSEHFIPTTPATASDVPRADCASAAAEEWQPILEKQMGGTPVVMEAHGRLLVVYTAPHSLAQAARAIALQPAVAYVTPRRMHFLHSLQDVALQVQANGAASGGAQTAQLQFWEAGVNGSGQVIGVGDSGIDVEHCAFADANVPFDSFTTDDSRVPMFDSATHRKIALYYMFADGLDDAGGHGTHVAGILAANPLSSPQNRGVAPAAKLAFFDLGAASVQAWISAPVGLDRSYFPVAYGSGARVHSDSWGSNAVHYDADAEAVDRYSHRNQDFLSVFSAGNFGTLQSSYNTTVNSPALAKNTLAAGNALPGGLPWRLPTAPAGAIGQLKLAINGVEAVETVFVLAEFSGEWDSLPTAGVPVKTADPVQACTEFTDTEGVKGALVLVERGSCGFDTKADAAARAGARAVIVGNQEDTFVVMQRSSAGPAAIPAGLVPRSTFQFLLSLALSGQPLVATYAGEFDIAELDSSESMDASSSRGPTADGRIKPDLAAPGTITSAKSLTACGLAVKSGTSMAAPVLAASAALVRQYFADGFYPGGVGGKGVGHSASGPLTKAVLIGGAAHMRGFSGDVALPMASPSPVQGWGRIDLAGSLPLQSGETVANMQIVDLAELSEGRATQVFCIDALPGRLAVTLVWHDPPSSPAASTLLVNDLDLEVRMSALGGVRLHSQGAPHPDRVNNVERVVLDNAPQGRVAISVKAHRLMTGSQPYALVVQGAFSGFLQHEKNPALLDQGASNEDCVVLAAEITIHPDPLTADGAPAFAFRSLTGVMPALGFECQLRSSDADKLPAWEACKSPKEYFELRDGAYVFSVRIAGEDLADSFEFIVDKSPPLTKILQGFGYDSASPLAVSLPKPTSGQQVAAFSMRSTDSSAVDLTCKLAGPVTATALPPGAHFTVGKEYNCSSPQVFSVTTAGSYQFSVFGTDAVGNWEQDPAVHQFSIAYENGSMYTAVDGPSWGVSQKRSHTFKLTAVQGTPDGTGVAPSEPVEFTYSVGTLTHMHAQDSAWQDTPWTALNGSSLEYTAAADGQVRVRMRTAHAGFTNVVALWRLTIDSTPPTVTFLVEPPEVLLADAVVIHVVSDEEGSTWQCALIDGSFSTVDAELLQLCPVTAAGVIEFGTPPGDEGKPADTALKDGQPYTFAVRAIDPVGNASPIQLRQFLVDLSAPQVLNMVVPNATRMESVPIVFAVTDGSAGTGVASVQCGLRWLGNSPANATDWGPCQKAKQSEAPSGEGCEECAWYRQTIETREEGVWGFSVRTRDAANQTATTAEAVVVVDRQAPEASWESGGTPRNPSPSEFRMQIQALDKGPYKSGVEGVLCALRPDGGSVDAAFQEQAEASVLLPLEARQGQDDFRYTDTLQQELRGGFGVWHTCALPVHIKNMPTGTYRFDARPVDQAGNVGGTLTTNVTVESSLAPDAALSKGGEARSMETWVLALLAAGGVVVCLAIAGTAIWASQRRRRRQGGHRMGVTVVHAADESPMWTGATRNQMAKQDDARLNRALEMSMVEAGVSASRAQHRDDMALELAIQASLHEIERR